MRPGSHASGDGSFGRSAGHHAGKAVGLIVIAVLLGVLLLRHGSGPVAVSAVGSTATTTTTRAPSTTVPARAGVGPTTTTPATTTTTLPLRTPANVKVLVANGTSVSGAASHFSDKLHGAGYNTLASTNTTAKVPATSVYFAPGFQREAAGVAQQLGLPAGAVKALPVQVPVPSLNGADVLVAVGPDLADAIPAPPTTTTTHSTGTSTTRPATTTTTKA